MRVMVDTNILVSAILLDSKRMDELFKNIFSKHSLVISSYVISELFIVAKEKFPDRTSVIDGMLDKMPYELVYTPKEIEAGLFEVRDPDDYPVLYSALKDNVDVLITGDKDLLAVEIGRPDILTPQKFIERYGKKDTIRRCTSTLRTTD
jgi:putative PIN family toxin of toxin-antitoxin system